MSLISPLFFINLLRAECSIQDYPPKIIIKLKSRQFQKFDQEGRFQDFLKNLSISIIFIVMRIGILFGGSSREREVSFAGGRTVYDNLDKSLFTPIPIFIDPYQNLCILDWLYLYKGSIRDFYDPENLDLEYLHTYPHSSDPLRKIGKPISLEELRNHIDFAFLTLHGENGEDGRIQGILEWLGIPYSGTGILSSAIGMDKALQKNLLKTYGFPVPPTLVIKNRDWFESDPRTLYNQCLQDIGLPMVIKSAHQGSSIGVHILRKDSFSDFVRLMNQSLFIETIQKDVWNSPLRYEIIRHIIDFREGTGLPSEIDGEIIYNEKDLIKKLGEVLNPETGKNEVKIMSLDSENVLIIEAFVEGKEFSCIVLENLDDSPLALPPTEIMKPEEVFNYRSKYLPGLSNKITPILEPEEIIEKICLECERLYTQLGFNVYARIDGFLDKKGNIYLNDPNTTSGMLPSSFFFHQAAEIGLNPSQFLTYIIYRSLLTRLGNTSRPYLFKNRLKLFQDKWSSLHNQNRAKMKVGVIFGGYSSERHISVESGRNIFEKLASSSEFEPIPLFLSGNADLYSFFKIPINILLKDNADDIRDKIEDYKIHPLIQKIQERGNEIIDKFSTRENLSNPEFWDYTRMKKELDFVFIALHGRPGEDGEIQLSLEKYGIPYNGSGVESSRITIDKYITNELLAQHGVLVPRHFLLKKEDWKNNPDLLLEKIEMEFGYPFIAKPSDDGCSSAVIKIQSKEEFRAYTEMLFRSEPELPDISIKRLHLNPREEIPKKSFILIEEMISQKDADHFMEITGGLLTHNGSDGEIFFEMLEPSEALAGKGILSLEEKFLAGEGQNITPPRYSTNPEEQINISLQVRKELEKTARILGIRGYCRIDAFVRIYYPNRVEVIIIEANSLPGMTPATAIFHQAALSGYRPFDFIQKIIDFGMKNPTKNILKSGQYETK